MILPKNHRSPKEEFLYSNFPEVLLIEDRLASLQAYAIKVQEAINAYNAQETDKIYLNVAELRKMLDMSFDITDILGMADNVCYDILTNVRSIQEGFNELIYAHLSSGNVVVSNKPKPASEGGTF